MNKNKATVRPTSLQLQKEQARQDRRAAAADRRAERAAGTPTELDTRRSMYANVGK